MDTPVSVHTHLFCIDLERSTYQALSLETENAKKEYNQLSSIADVPEYCWSAEEEVMMNVYMDWRYGRGGGGCTKMEVTAQGKFTAYRV